MACRRRASHVADSLTNPKPIRFLFGTPPSAGRRPAIFLDRDGVINERILNGYVTAWRQFRFIDHAVATLRELSRLRLPILVVSNQSGVGRGALSRHDLEQITRRFVSALGRHSVRIDGVYYCPHHPDEGCSCRKPKPGLLLQAARDWQIDLRASVMIGDAITDIQAAQAAGCRGILLASNQAGTESCSPPNFEPAPEPVIARTLEEIPCLVVRFRGNVAPASRT